MLKNVRLLIISVSLSLLFAGSGHANEVREDPRRAETWNRFVEFVYELHLQRINKLDTYTTERLGGYGGVTNDLEFYREKIYHEKGTDRLISNIKWETDNPNNLHAINHYIYNPDGRINREYMAYFLPVHRKAPYQTYINLYTHNDDLTSLRQYDASDNLIFEMCTGKYNGENVRLIYNDYEIPDTPEQIPDLDQQLLYIACFDNAPDSAIRYTRRVNE